MNPLPCKIFGLADCNSFFASCEKVFHPQWQNRPVIVLSNNDGCVVARSPEAKQFIAMGAPYFRVKNIIERHGIIVRSSNFSLYGDMSRRVMQTLSQWTKEMEVYSIDEAFLDLSEALSQEELAQNGIAIPFKHLGQDIIETVMKWTGIPISLGIGPTKTLAKTANKIAKGRSERYFSLLSPEERKEGLASVAIEDVWGVGRRLLPKFQRLGLKTAWDLSRVDPLYMRRNFSILQEGLVRELNGEVCFDLDEKPEPRKNIQVSRSFGEMIESLADLETSIASFAAKGAEKLRAQKSAASAIFVQLYTNRFRQDQSQYFPGLVTGFPAATSDSREIIKTALEALRKIYRPHYAYKRASIQLMGLVDEEAAHLQSFLFEPDPDRSSEDRQESEKLMKAIDAMNKTLGAGRIFFASEGIDQKWRPSSEFQSPAFTTNWDELPNVKAK